MQPNLGISAEHLANAAHALNIILADEYILYTKTRNAHWNVEGADFHAKHLFFETQYHELDEIIDGIAERIRSLGHYAAATLQSFLALTHFTETIRNNNDGAGFIKELLNDHESLIMHLRTSLDIFANDFKDMGTSDYLTGLMETHEKMAWMLRAHLK